VKLEVEQVLCRFQLSNLARHHAEPLYEWIVEQARHEDLQGATVLKGFMGLQADGTIVREHRSVAHEVPSSWRSSMAPAAWRSCSHASTG
jgi:PII-like signaling protein